MQANHSDLMIKNLSKAIMLKLKLQNLFSKRREKDIRRKVTGNDITGKDITLADLTGKDIRS